MDERKTQFSSAEVAPPSVSNTFLRAEPTSPVPPVTSTVTLPSMGGIPAGEPLSARGEVLVLVVSLLLSMAGDLRGESGGEGRGQQAAKRRAHRLKEALQVYDAAEAAEDAAEDALAEHLAAWRVSSFSGGASSVKHAASLADVPSLAPCDRLDLSGRGLAVLEARHLRGLTHLLELSLVGNRLASLPRTLAQMPNLRSLNLVRAAPPLLLPRTVARPPPRTVRAPS